MPRVPFKDPSPTVRLPVRYRIISPLRIAAHRALPIAWSLRATAAFYRLSYFTRPGQRRWLVSLLKAFHPQVGDRRELRRLIELSRAIRRLGAYTYAPVFRRSREWLLEAFRPEGLEYLDSLKAAASGAILLGTHAGLNAWTAPVLCQLGYPVRFIQRAVVAPDTLLLMRREGAADEVLPYAEGESAGVHMKRLHDLLAAGAWIQHVSTYPGNPAVRGSCLGRPLECTAAPWALARLSRAAIVPSLILVERDATCRLVIGEPIRVSADGPRQEGLDAAFRTYLDFLSCHLGPRLWNVHLKNWQKLLVRP